mgnify:CR=1 FL=1
MFLAFKSANAKLGDMAATYLPIKQTCPDTCALKETSCYAQTSFVGMHVKRLEKKFAGYKPNHLVYLESLEIKKVGPKAKGKPLRLHVSGDVQSVKSVKHLANAAEKWDGPVYSYTHSWKNIPVKNWGKISVLASVENISDAAAALKAGYAPAIVVKHHEDEKAYMNNGIKIIPCPNQTRDVKCQKCGLCMNSNMLKEQNAAIAFSVHGVRKKNFLKVIQPNGTF